MPQQKRKKNVFYSKSWFEKYFLWRIEDKEENIVDTEPYFNVVCVQRST